MKIPNVCPYCGDAMLNNYIDMNDSTVLSQICSLRPDHVIKIRSNADGKSYHRMADTLTVRVDMSPPMTWAIWDFREQTITIAKSSFTYTVGKKHGSTLIPFFEPDLSDYPKLIDKLRTYIAFS